MAKNEVSKTNRNLPAYKQKDSDTKVTTSFTHGERRTYGKDVFIQESFDQMIVTQETKNSKKK
ncbi:hypothetical protein [Treponema zioleckii]|uniref:hypothetical protein n=1 Tax=Treponema zioleckii TaxID=331680 RepID=UPI00168AC66C|nr:hypothetical protein [Treponema zioleckii]